MTTASGFREINFDGLIGPSHNYAGLSLGNLAATMHAGKISRPREAALQGLAKMRLMLSLGLGQGFFLPHERPNVAWLRQFGFGGSDAQVCAQAWREEPLLFAQACSASAMWAANAATVSPAPDTADGRTHFTVANLSTMAHRSHEWPETLRQLRHIFADQRYFAVHEPVPARFGDEGAANFMRLAAPVDERGVEIMVYGEAGGAFPARQSAEGCRAIFRRHGIESSLTVQQSPEAIAAGAFHNDVVAVAHENILFAHEEAFADKDAFYEALQTRCNDLVIVEVPASEVSLEAAIASYLFNSQLVTLPDGQRALILPMECKETPSVRRWIEANVGANGPIHAAHFIDVRESMHNGGGPACLRLRVLLSPEAERAVNPAYLLDARTIERLEAVVSSHWPEQLSPTCLGLSDSWQHFNNARGELLAVLEQPFE
ncbi:MAG: N-succinylarginine dihydrolase [Alphaproteobacteria bacterium]|nr:N-succinylarginine dihydrolase [Alphaproteobacteria bacterium]MBU0793363.1 N-succinylarginine dihydrolase [Alphaproteobacteria bacterium]MBU0876310.1 N-succinylarginine dihydrolase [Alphaproteobacteria bacterium]MBU1768235.1 N-succinylarginine dihydrolase [Alphaproteobacteria bacterium]